MKKFSLKSIYHDRIMMLRISRISRKQSYVEWTTTRMGRSTGKN
jgi:hypothetical protein